MGQLEDLFSVFPLIESERLTLYQLTPEDAADFLTCHADPEVFRSSRCAAETSLESAKHTLDLLSKQHQERILLRWAIVLKANQHVIGRIRAEHTPRQMWKPSHRDGDVGNHT